jgi:hypothetical protein
MRQHKTGHCQNRRESASHSETISVVSCSQSSKLARAPHRHAYRRSGDFLNSNLVFDVAKAEELKSESHQIICEEPVACTPWGMTVDDIA